jgi:hypothetical protein
MTNNGTIVARGLGFEYSSRVFCEWLLEDDSSMRFLITGRDAGQSVLIRFERPLAYRKMDEGDYQRALRRARGLPRVICYEDLQSDFISEFIAASDGMAERYKMRHFMFATENVCIDVISELEPIITLVGSGYWEKPII